VRWNTRTSSDPSPAWTEAWASAVARWDHLDGMEVDRLRDQAWRLTLRCRWEGLDGLEVTPAMQGVIATEGCLLSVNVGSSIFRDVTSILVAPTVQNRVTRHRISSSVVSEAPACVLGESLLHGPVRLAWDQIVADRSRSSSVIVHEFSHKFDMADGDVDGEPPLGSRERARRFNEVVASVMHLLAHASDPEPLSEYALTNRAEFFACASEAFFLRSRSLRERFGDLYAVLSDLYQQNPASSG
jgi:Mlc titration factor MtfA (ptsG expression regulator)